jgi:hypothetical protein
VSPNERRLVQDYDYQMRLTQSLFFTLLFCSNIGEHKRIRIALGHPEGTTKQVNRVITYNITTTYYIHAYLFVHDEILFYQPFPLPDDITLLTLLLREE